MRRSAATSICEHGSSLRRPIDWHAWRLSCLAVWCPVTEKMATDRIEPPPDDDLTDSNLKTP